MEYANKDVVFSKMCTKISKVPKCVYLLGCMTNVK